jgi:hypothetical protein
MLLAQIERPIETSGLQWTFCGSAVPTRQGFITLKTDETKSGHSRAVPILDGDMRTWLERSRNNANGAMDVSHNEGERIKDFRCVCRSIATGNGNQERETLGPFEGCHWRLGMRQAMPAYSKGEKVNQSGSRLGRHPYPRTGVADHAPDFLVVERLGKKIVAAKV